MMTGAPDFYRPYFGHMGWPAPIPDVACIAPFCGRRLSARCIAYGEAWNSYMAGAGKTEPRMFCSQHMESLHYGGAGVLGRQSRWSFRRQISQWPNDLSGAGLADAVLSDLPANAQSTRAAEAPITPKLRVLRRRS